MTRPFDPYGSPLGATPELVLVNASAGTGKTWMVTFLATRWLLEGDRRPDELLIVTFSRAAAGELKHRLRAHVHEVGEALAAIAMAADVRADAVGDTPWTAWLTRLIHAVGLEELRDRHTRIARDLDRASTRTIHSFAALTRRLDDASLVDDALGRVRAVHEELTRRATSGGGALDGVLDRLESDESRVTPGAAQLASTAARALAVAEGAGGFASGRVTRVGNDTDEEIIVADLLGAAEARLAVERRRAAIVTFDDLVAELHADVGREESAVAARLREQFGLVLIDEFQDTDLLQWETFASIFRDARSRTPVIAVGDPKQAIYGFRGGDVTVVERVIGEVDRDATDTAALTLTENHRTAEGLLTALNTLFGASVEGWEFGDGVTPIPYVALHPSASRRDEPGRLVLRETGDGDRDADVAAVVRELVVDHGVVPADVAVLCRSRRRVQVLQRELARVGVRTVTSGGTRVVDAPAAAQLRALLWSVGALGTPRRARLVDATWFGSLGATGAADVAHALDERGVPAASALILDAVAAGTAASTVAERDWTDLVHLLDLLGTASPGPLAPEHALARFDDVVTTARGRDDAGQRRVESDRDAVALLTIHAAKGLQFPVVVISEIEIRSRTSPPVQSWTTPTGRCVDIGALLRAPHPDSPYAAREAAEARRLMYVALTRAERLCVAWVDGAGQWPTLVAPVLARPRDDLLSSGIDVRPAGEPLGDLTALGLRGPGARASASPHYRGPAPTMDQSGRRWSYSALRVTGTLAHVDDAADAEDPAPVTREEDSVLFDGAFGARRGAAVGRAVHRVFEHVVGVHTSTATEALVMAVDDAWTEEGLGVPEPTIATDVGLVLARSLGPLADGLTLDQLVGDDRTAPEVRFTLPLHAGEGPDRLAALGALLVARDPEGPFADFFATTSGGVPGQLARGFLTGSLDLVLEVGTPARYVVVDYKTNYLAPPARYRADELRADMVAAGYPLQALLYSVALHRFLRGRVRGYDPDHHLGGVIYLYVRGAARATNPDDGLMTWRPPASAIVAASDLLDGWTP